MSNFARNGTNWILAGSVIVALTLVVAFARDRLRGDSEPRQVSSSAPSSDAGSRLVDETNGAIDFWEERIARDPHDFIAANKLADLYLRRAQHSGDVADIGRAEAALVVSLDIMRSQNYEAEVLLAHVHNLKHEFGHALALSQSVVAAYPDEDFGWGVLGDAQLALGRYDEAERSYERMVALAPGLASFSRMAHVAEIMGDPEGARVNWRDAINAEGGDLPDAKAWAAAQLGHLEFSQGDLEASESQYTRSLQLFPGYVHALAGQARVLAARGDLDAAALRYEEAIAVVPLPEYVIALGDVYAAAGDNRRADEQYEIVAAIEQLYLANGVNLDQQIVLFNADHGRDLQATVARAEALFEAQQGIYAADALAWARYRAGDVAGALTAARSAMRTGSRDPLLLFHSGIIYKAAGEADSATDLLSRLRDQNAQFSVLHADEARQALEDLESAAAR